MSLQFMQIGQDEGLHQGPSSRNCNLARIHNQLEQKTQENEQKRDKEMVILLKEVNQH
jgi:hypothetical protein